MATEALTAGTPATGTTSFVAGRSLNLLGTSVRVRATHEGLLTRAERSLAPDPGTELAPWSFLAALPAPAVTRDGVGEFTVDLISKDGAPNLTWSDTKVTVSGALEILEERAPDPRYTLFGNAGLASRAVYFALERHHSTLSLHAAVLATPDCSSVVIAAGTAGAGKTDIVLEGLLNRGMRLVSTEMAHLRIAGDTVDVLRGSLHDNIRIDSIPQELVGTSRVAPDGGRQKVCVSLEKFAAPQTVISGARLRVVFPRIEGGRRSRHLSRIGDQGSLATRLYESASEMLVRPRVYWGQFPVPTAELPDSPLRRWDLVRQLVRSEALDSAWTLFGGRRDCLRDLV